MSVLNEPAISQAYFMPQPHRFDDAIEVDVGDAILRCHHHIANSDGRTLIHFHGNGEAVAQYANGDYPEMISPQMNDINVLMVCLLYTSQSPRDRTRSRMPSSA